MSPSKISPMLPILTVLVVLSTLGSSCSLTPPSFDEAAWKAKAQSADPALLYAPHFKDDLFFNPWMPDEDKSFFSVLKWRLTASQEYTEEEKTYLPRVIDKGERADSRHAPGRFHYVDRT